MKKLLLVALILALIVPTVASAETFRLFFAETLRTAQVDGATVEYYRIGTRNVPASRVIKIGEAGGIDAIMYATTDRSLLKAARKIDSFIGSSFYEIAMRIVFNKPPAGFTTAQLTTFLKATMEVVYEGPDVDESGDPVEHRSKIGDWISAGTPGTYLYMTAPVAVLGVPVNE
jgi:hypothetical protein